MKLNEVLQERILLKGRITLSKLKAKKLQNAIIDCDDMINLNNSKLDKPPVKFGKVKYFNCKDNNLTSLENCPEEASEMHLSKNKITSLKGAPEQVRIFYCDRNELTSLDYVPKYTDHLSLGSNKITSLVGIHKKVLHTNNIWLDYNIIKEGGIGLLLIEGLQHISSSECGLFTKASVIIAKYLKQGKSGLLACQEELIDAGLGAFAKL